MCVRDQILRCSRLLRRRAGSDIRRSSVYIFITVGPFILQRFKFNASCSRRELLFVGSAKPQPWEERPITN